MKVALVFLAVTLLAGAAKCAVVPGAPCEGTMVLCFVAPCDVTKCDAISGTTCMDDYCDGCSAHFYLNGQEVTDQCKAAAPTK